MKKLITILTMLAIIFSISSMPVCAVTANKKTDIKEQLELSVPVLKSKTADKSTIRLSWNSVKGADSYILYILNPKTNKFKKLTETEKLSYRHSGLKAESKYVYVLRAKAVIDGVDVYSKFSKRQNIYLGYKIGNTPGNIQNEGKVAFDGEWIYFSLDGLAKIKPDGTGFTKISDDTEISYINVVDGYVYYIIKNYNNETKYYYDMIVKIKTDGTNRTELIDNLDNGSKLRSEIDELIYRFNQMMVINNTIYFKVDVQSSGDGSNEAYYELCMDTNGDNLKRCEACFDDVVYDGYRGDNPNHWALIANYYGEIPNVFYVEYHNSGDDFSGPHEVSTDTNKIIHVENDDIYYYDNGFKMKSLDDNKTTVLCNKYDFITQYPDMTPSDLHMNYYDGWVYYNIEYFTCIYRVRLDGTNSSKVSDIRTRNIYSAGDWIIFIGGDGKFYKIRPDGTDEQLLVPESETNG